MFWDCFRGVFIILELNVLHEIATGGSSTSIPGGNQVDGLPPDASFPILSDASDVKV